MGESADAGAGRIVWRDLTVRNAEEVRDFYAGVVGWTSKDHDMGGYADYEMYAPGEDACMAGICHARGPNADLPPAWLLYVQVEDVAASARRAEALGGRVLDGPRPMGAQTFCVVQDPAGAVLALIG